jgi:hypothetical protein
VKAPYKTRLAAEWKPGDRFIYNYVAGGQHHKNVDGITAVIESVNLGGAFFTVGKETYFAGWNEMEPSTEVPM